MVPGVPERVCKSLSYFGAGPADRSVQSHRIVGLAPAYRYSL